MSDHEEHSSIFDEITECVFCLADCLKDGELFIDDKENPISFERIGVIMEKLAIRVVILEMMNEEPDPG